MILILIYSVSLASRSAQMFATQHVFQARFIYNAIMAKLL